MQGSQLLTIEGRNDLSSGRADTDVVTAKKNLQGKAFKTLCYTADGQCLLAAGQSKNICIYQVKWNNQDMKFWVVIHSFHLFASGD